MDPRNLHVVDHVKARLTVFIAPAFINEIEEGIKLELDEHLYRYMEDQEAVLLAYSNIMVLSKQALLSNYFPYLAIECSADLVLFRPNPREIIVGRVHKLSAGIVGILVLGGVSASVAAGDMPQGFHFDPDHNCWVPEGDYHHAIMMGDYVACKVLSPPVVDPESQELVYTLDATLLADDTGLLEVQPPQQRKRRAAVAAAAEADGLMGTWPGKEGAADAAGAAAAGQAAGKADKVAGNSTEKQEKRRAKQERKKEKQQEKHTAKRKDRDAEQAEQPPPSKRSKHNSSSETRQQQQPPQQQQQPQQPDKPQQPHQQPQQVVANGVSTPAAAEAHHNPSSSSKKKKSKHSDKERKHKHSDKKSKRKEKDKKSKRKEKDKLNLSSSGGSSSKKKEKDRH